MKPYEHLPMIGTIAVGDSADHRHKYGCDRPQEANLLPLFQGRKEKMASKQCRSRLALKAFLHN